MFSGPALELWRGRVVPGQEIVEPGLRVTVDDAADDVPDLPVLETGGNHGGLVYADVSALVRLLVRSARQAKIGELLKIERHRRLHGGWTEQSGIGCGSPSRGARRMQRRRWRSPPGDVAALVREQEGHQLCNILRRSVTVHRHLPHPLLACSGVRNAIMSVSIGPG